MNERSDGPGDVLSELRRRKVVRVAVMYAGAAFVVLQVADILVPALRLPVWTMTMVVVLLAIGLAVAIAVAWAYELTPDGVRRADAAQAEGRLFPRPLIAGAVLFAATLAVGAWWLMVPQRGEASRTTVAVLPFENIAAEPGEDHFAAGMRAEIMSQLSKVAELRLISGAAIAALASAPDRLPALVSELNVGSVVEGSVRVIGQQVRVQVQLTDARTGRTLWSDQYDRDIADAFAVQTEVALRIVRELHATLSSDERARLERLPTQNAAAYELFLRGRQSWRPFERDALITTGALYREAIRLDSTFALAHAHLARVYLFLAYQGDAAALDSGLIAAHRAIAADSTQSFGHYALGDLLSESGRLGAARTSYQRALRFDPSAWAARTNLSVNLATAGRLDESLRVAQEAMPLAPNLALSYYHVGIPLLALGDYDTAEPFLLHGATRAPPAVHRIHLQLALLDAYRGRYVAALERLRQQSLADPANFEVRLVHADVAEIARAPEADSLLEALFHGNADANGWGIPQTIRTRHAAALLRQGENARGAQLLADALARARTRLAAGYESPQLRMEIAAIRALQGEANDALEWLQRGYDAGYRNAGELSRNPLYDAIRDRSEFGRLARNIDDDIARMRAAAAIPAAGND